MTCSRKRGPFRQKSDCELDISADSAKSVVHTRENRLRVTNSGRGNSANSPVNNFGIDAYAMINYAGALVRKDTNAMINSAGALVRKDSYVAVYKKWKSYHSRKARYEATYRIFLNKNHQHYKR